MNIRIKMEKLINLLRERKPNFDENHILDYMYSQWTIFIKDWKPVYAYDEDIFPNTELMIISKKECFIKRLVDNDKIDRHSNKLELDMKRMRIPQDYYISWAQSLDLQHKKAQYLSLIALLSIQDDPIKFICEILQ